MKKKSSSGTLQRIEDYLNGKLGPDEIDELWAHLLQYPEYYSHLKIQAGLKKKHRNRLKEKNLKEKTKKRIPIKPSLTIALAAVIVIALFLFLYRSHMNSVIKPPLKEFSLLHLVTPDVTRSSADQLPDLQQSFHNAFLLSVSGDIDGALATYKRLLEEETNHDAVKFNMAILYYNRKNYPKAASLFARISCSELNGFSYEESCYWLKTNSFLATSDLQQAVQSASRTVQLRGNYRNEAFELLMKMKDAQ